MDSGWIKLWRKTIENPIFLRDRTAWFIFEWLLLSCNHKTGERTCGRYQLSEVLEIKPITIYKALKRLEKAKMIILVTSQGQAFTTVKIANWNEYQRNDNKSVTSEEQVSNTKQELRIKNEEQDNTIDLSKKELNELQKKFPTKNVYSECEQANDWLASSGKKYKDYSAFFRNWLRRSKDSRIPPKVWTPPVDIPIDQVGIDRVSAIKQKIADSLRP